MRVMVEGLQPLFFLRFLSLVDVAKVFIDVWRRETRLYRLTHLAKNDRWLLCAASSNHTHAFFLFFLVLSLVERERKTAISHPRRSIYSSARLFSPMSHLLIACETHETNIEILPLYKMIVFVSSLEKSIREKLRHLVLFQHQKKILVSTQPKERDINIIRYKISSFGAYHRLLLLFKYVFSFGKEREILSMGSQGCYDQWSRTISVCYL